MPANSLRRGPVRNGTELSERAFGIEFEFKTRGRVGRDGVRRSSLEEWGAVLAPVLGHRLRVRPSYCHSDGAQWELKLDGSCGFELATPRLTRADWPLVVQVLQALWNAGARVNRNCGLHVHHEVNDYDDASLRRLVGAWVMYGEVIGSILPPSRRHNDYCLPLPRRLLTATLGRDLTSRYAALNILPYWVAGRVEVRQHQGTLKAEKVLAWLVLTQRMVETALRRGTFTPRRVDAAQAIMTRDLPRGLASLGAWAGVPARVLRRYRVRIAA